MFEYMLEKRKDEFMPLMVDLKLSKEGQPRRQSVSSKLPELQSLEEILMAAIEDAVIRPVYPRIAASMGKLQDKEKARAFKARAKRLRDKDQAFFHVATDHMSPSNWHSVVFDAL